MSYSKIPFGSAILGISLVVTFTTRIMGTARGYSEHVAYNLADVTHLHRFDSAICSRAPEWYRQGMKVFAFEFFGGRRWNKKILSWSIDIHPTRMTKGSVEAVVAAAFVKWATVSPFVFIRARPNEKADITFFFLMDYYRRLISMTRFNTERFILDDGGAYIIIADDLNWTNPTIQGWYNLRFVVLHEIGHALGIADSRVCDAVMYGGHRGFLCGGDPALQIDDISGIQTLYPDPYDQPLHRDASVFT